MKNPILLALVLPLAAAAGELQVTADTIAADRTTGNVIVTGNVHAVYHTDDSHVSLLSQLAVRDGDDYRFGPGTEVTTCTNAPGHFHWSAVGAATFHGTEGEREIVARNVWINLLGVPVFWLPWWMYPLDTDYGWRVMPGYTGKWGGFLLVKYVYHLAGDFEDGHFGLRGNTRADWRYKNGFALGQSLTWQLGDYGRGKFKVYYAWDQDADRYDRHWTTRRYNYQNWGSTVPDDRYALMLRHQWDVTERDTLRLQGKYYSDSHFSSDFLRDSLLSARNAFDTSANEIAWEHVENPFGLGLSVSGPLNDFYDGVARLPEFYFDIAPQPFFGLPVNYESASRIGWLNRNYARYGTAATAAPFRYTPGQWADYQAFRFDTYHRLTYPFKVADVLSVVPRVGARGTYWSDTGRENLTGYGRAGATGDDAWRSIVESGVTFAARGSADYDNGYNHLLEPYFDVLAQKADYHGLDRGVRPFVFDSLDASRDYLDQFAGRSRNLPYTYYGVTPGVRNALRKIAANGRLKTLFDFDLYTAVQFNDTDYTAGNRYHRLARDPADPNFGRSSVTVMPGFRARWTPCDDINLHTRLEYDTRKGSVAYADVGWSQALDRSLSYSVSFIHRDCRQWDFAASPYNPARMTEDGMDWADFSLLSIEFEHEICDAVAWSPYVNWDCRRGELDGAGSWFDYRTDCLGFRFIINFDGSVDRIDRSHEKHDWSCGFFIYLRALGASTGNPLH